MNLKGVNKKLDTLLCCAPSVIQDILSQLYLSGGQLLAQNIIDKKVPAYNCQFTKDGIELVMTATLIFPDEEIYDPNRYPEDSEPSPLQSEPWMRNYLLADKQARPVTLCFSVNGLSPSEKLNKNSKMSRPMNMTPRMKDKNPSVQLAPIDLSEPLMVN